MRRTKNMSLLGNNIYLTGCFSFFQIGNKKGVFCLFLATMTLALMARFSANNYIPQGF